MNVPAEGKAAAAQAERAREPIAITGVGLVTSLGLSASTTWQAVMAGQCGIGPLTAVESPLAPDKGGGQAPDPPGVSGMFEPREVVYLRLAIREALHDAGALEALPYAPARCGWLLGTTLHGMRSVGRFLRANDTEPLKHFLAGATLAEATRGFGLEGIATTVCSACSSGLAGMTLAVTLLECGEVDMVVAGGYDPISEYAYAGFNSMRLVTGDALRPFSRDRSGMKLGEGYGVVVLERAADAARRGADVLACIAGFGESCDAHHLSKPHPTGDGAARAMTAALASAGVAARDVDLIAAHATATPDNDAAEFAALARVFGTDLSAIPVVALKSRLGHTLGGAGAVELILSLMAMRAGVVPSCANVSRDEVEFDGLRLACGDPVSTPVRHTMNTSLGFGGANVCVVLAADPVGRGEPCCPDQARIAHATSNREVVITGVGVVLPRAIGNDPYVALLRAAHGPALNPDDPKLCGADVDHLLNARRTRRMSDYVKFTLASAAVAYRDAGIEDAAGFGSSCSAILGTTHGSTTFSERYYREIVESGVDRANPLLFAEGVPNAASAHLSTMLGLKGLCQTVIGTRTAGLDALRLASLRISSGLWDRALVSAGEEYSPVVIDAYRHFGLARPAGGGADSAASDGFVAGCGAVTLVLEARDAAEQRGARVRGVIMASAAACCSAPSSRAGVATVAGVVAKLGSPDLLVGSGNDTWLGRLERAAVRRVGRHAAAVPGSARASLSTVYSSVGECFSVLPLAGLAGVLLAGEAVVFTGPHEENSQAAMRAEVCAGIGVLATDYTGVTTGIAVRRCNGAV